MYGAAASRITGCNIAVLVVGGRAYKLKETKNEVSYFALISLENITDKS